MSAMKRMGVLIVAVALSFGGIAGIVVGVLGAFGAFLVVPAIAAQRPDVMVVRVLSVLLVLVSIRIRRLSRRLRHAPVSVDAIVRSGRSPVLYLRWFERDREMSQERSFLVDLLPFLNPFFLFQKWRETPVTEDLGRLVATNVGPLIAIQNPRDLLPIEGLSAERVEDNRWEQRLVELLGISQLAIVHIDPRPAVLFELLSALRSRGWTRVILLLPMKRDAEWDGAWSQVQSSLPNLPLVDPSVMAITFDEAGVASLHRATKPSPRARLKVLESLLRAWPRTAAALPPHAGRPPPVRHGGSPSPRSGESLPPSPALDQLVIVPPSALPARPDSTSLFNACWLAALSLCTLLAWNLLAVSSVFEILCAHESRVTVRDVTSVLWNGLRPLWVLACVGVAVGLKGFGNFAPTRRSLRWAWSARASWVLLASLRTVLFALRMAWLALPVRWASVLFGLLPSLELGAEIALWGLLGDVAAGLGRPRGPRLRSVAVTVFSARAVLCVLTSPWLQATADGPVPWSRSVSELLSVADALVASVGNGLLCMAVIEVARAGLDRARAHRERPDATNQGTFARPLVWGFLASMVILTLSGMGSSQSGDRGAWRTAAVHSVASVLSLVGVFVAGSLLSSSVLRWGARAAHFGVARMCVALSLQAVSFYAVQCWLWYNVDLAVVARRTGYNVRYDADGFLLAGSVAVLIAALLPVLISLRVLSSIKPLSGGAADGSPPRP